MEEPAILMVRSGLIFNFMMMITSPSSIMSSSAESDTWPSIGMSMPTSAPRPKPIGKHARSWGEGGVMQSRWG